jgi:hypothetical protein
VEAALKGELDALQQVGRRAEEAQVPPTARSPRQRATAAARPHRAGPPRPQGLERRKEIAAARATLELMQEVAHVASKVEKLLAEVAAAVAAAGDGGGADGVPRSPRGGAPGGRASADGGGGGTDGVGSLSSLDTDPDALTRLLERVAGEVSRLGFLANKGKVRPGGHGRL